MLSIQGMSIAEKKAKLTLAVVTVPRKFSPRQNPGMGKTLYSQGVA
jgi:hypothetical protein